MEYELTDEELEELLDACKPVPYLIIGGVEPRSPQENANAAWRRLGEKRGFKFMTVIPRPEKGDKFFRAEPLED
jgi:predicted TIM-barrel fold metal-dependent hydrolase